jgi:hypothetical protein
MSWKLFESRESILNLSLFLFKSIFSKVAGLSSVFIIMSFKGTSFLFLGIKLSDSSFFISEFVLFSLLKEIN